MVIQQQKLSEEELNHKRVLLIGDNCIDSYVFGTMDRISSEAPVPVFKQTKRINKDGMALNVRDNLESLGLNVHLLTHDEDIIKRRFIDDKTKQHVLRVDVENKTTPLSLKDLKSHNFEKYAAVVLSDYDKGYLSKGMCLTISEMCNKHKIPLFVDSKKLHLSIFEDAIIKINQYEYDNAYSLPQESNVIVTLGQDGAKLIEQKANKEHIFDPFRIEKLDKYKIRDVVGAGDTFLAALVAEFIRTNSINEAIEFANICAAISVTKFGVYTITDDDLKEFGVNRW